ncbi:MAG: hypothetical protein J5528_03480, partial [Firmicutes bacterium]|nr:hypothetical protein [Bacillota bacterium]
DYDLLEDGDTNNPILVSAVFSYVTATQLIDMQGTSTVLNAVVRSGDKDEVKTAVINGEVIENIETAVLGGRTLVAYTTSKTAYFDSASGKTVMADAIDANTERALIRCLYIREVTKEGFGTAKLVQQVVDFENCGADNLDSAKLKDGVYVNNALYGAGEADPHYANLKFLTASLDLKEDPETFMLFEMGGNTYILRQSGILSLLSGSNAQVSLTPVFASAQGTDVTIGSDGKKLAVVYTAAMPNTLNNAVWIAWWDAGEGTWGAPNVLAMRHLQIYEDSITYEMSPEETELAYLGKIKTPGENEGSMSRFYFSDLQMSTREVYKDGETYQELMVLTEGSMIELQDFEYENISGDKIETVIPKRVKSEENQEMTVEVPPSVGFYAIAFGEGTQALDEIVLGFANYDFTSGHDLVGEVSFKNTGTAAIRASKSNPVTVILSVTRPKEGSQELAKWLLSESIPAGGNARLTFTTDPLTHDLPTGSKFSLYLTEDAKYIEDVYHGEAFSTTIENLFEVEEKAELAFGDFDAQLRTIDGEYAVVYVEGSVLNVGNKDAEKVFIQFTYDKGKEDEKGIRYVPINLQGNTLKTGKPELATRGKVTANDEIGVYMLEDEDGGKVIAKGYKRNVYGTIRVPVSAFIKGEDLSGLHLRAEIFSSDDEPDMANKVYASQHAEYNQNNNLVTKTVGNSTVFSVPSQVSLSLGNTLRLPVPYKTTANDVDIVVTEIDSGAEDWQSLLGILYYDSATNTIVAAANETAEAMIEEGLLPAGIIQIKDTATNSIAAITFRITEAGDGVNIFKDDKSFTFYNKDGKETDTDAAENANSSEGWYFAYNVLSDAWAGGETEGEIPMNSDLSRATQNGAYVKFLTTADTMKIYFSGKIKVESSAFGTAQEFTESPAELDFNNKSGLTHEITITATKNSELDRYTADYAVSPVVQRDDDAPQIFWSRSFPDTASMKPGTEMTIRCYIVDNGGVNKVSVNGKEVTNKTETRLWKVSDGLYYFDYTFTKNGDMEVVACDTVTNTVRMSFKVDWYNVIVSSSAAYDAPGLVPGMVCFVDDNGDPMPATGPINEAPWLYSEYKPGEDEESTVYMYLDGDFQEVKLEKGEGAEMWKIVSNGYYMVKVDREDGTWARVIIMMDRLDIDEPQISIEVEGTVINFTVSDDKEIATVTINGMPIEISGNPFTASYEPSLGGSYTIEVTDDAGHVTTRTVDIEVELEAPEDAVDMSITYDGKLIGTVKVDTDKLIGGQYDETVSDPAQGDYQAVYYAAVVPKDTDPSEIKDEDFKAAEDGVITITDIFDGEYDIYIKDSKGHIVKYDESFHVYHPDDQWKDPVYSWAWDYSSVTASRQ